MKKAIVICVSIWASWVFPLHAGSPEAVNVQNRWAWAGAVTARTAVIHAGAPEPGALLVSRDPDFGDAVTMVPDAVRDGLDLGPIGRYVLSELTPDTVYFYRWADQADVDFGRFRTMPEGPASFTIAFSSCAATGSEHAVFDHILTHDPLFFLHTGDLHYEDIAVNDLGRFQKAFRDVLIGSTRQNRFFRSVQVPYMWDDHDYGPNNSDIRAPGREAVLAAYRLTVPHYPLFDGGADTLAPVGQAFSAGRVRFLMPDMRSARDHNDRVDGPGKTMLGTAQLQWFKDQLLAAHEKYAVIVFVSGVPWIDSSTTKDSWAGYAHERRQISDFLMEHGIRNVVMIAGDSHMVAADDGRNNSFSTDGTGPGFPVYHAAALNRGGSVKGGPYSEGTSPGGARFGLLHIRDDGDSVSITFQGRHSREGVLIETTHTLEGVTNDE